MNEVIVAKDITKVYGKKNQVRALDGVSLSINSGEYVSLRGPSGSGKSTLLNILGCLDRPTNGSLKINGVDVGTMKDDELAVLRRERIGFIFQTFNLLPVLNARENVELPMETMKMTKAERKERANKLLKTVGLEDRWNHKPNELSGGERQRVAIARALANSPTLILADEPTGNLDSRTGKSIMKLLRELNHNLGTTIIVVTHDVRMAKKADKQFYVDDGKVKEKGGGKNAVKESLTETLGLSEEIARKLKRAGYKEVKAVVGLKGSQLSNVKGLNSKDVKKILAKIKEYKD